MKQLDWDRAVVERAKLTSYLLHLEHPEGSSKAVFFVQIGYSPAAPELLEKDLLKAARTGEIIETIATPYGTKYVVDGMTLSPAGRIYSIRMVWLIEPATDRPRFITAYPRPR